jgi:hypothetical protein
MVYGATPEYFSFTSRIWGVFSCLETLQLVTYWRGIRMPHSQFWGTGKMPGSCLEGTVYLAVLSVNQKKQSRDKRSQLWTGVAIALSFPSTPLPDLSQISLVLSSVFLSLRHPGKEVIFCHGG